MTGSNRDRFCWNSVNALKDWHSRSAKSVSGGGEGGGSGKRKKRPVRANSDG